VLRFNSRLTNSWMLSPATCLLPAGFCPSPGQVGRAQSVSRGPPSPEGRLLSLRHYPPVHRVDAPHGGYRRASPGAVPGLPRRRGAPLPGARRWRRPGLSPPMSRPVARPEAPSGSRGSPPGRSPPSCQGAGRFSARGCVRRILRGPPAAPCYVGPAVPASSPVLVLKQESLTHTLHQDLLGALGRVRGLRDVRVRDGNRPTGGGSLAHIPGRPP
jgi:hypothetical protein